MTAADRIEQLRNENDRLKRVNEHLRERLERELKRNAERKDRTMSIKRSEIRIGAAQDEDRAPSHDGEYLAVYYTGTEYILEGNCGVVASSRIIQRLRNELPVCSHEIGRWQSEAEAIVAEDAGEDWDAEHMGCEARALAAEFGWTH